MHTDSSPHPVRLSARAARRLALAAALICGLVAAPAATAASTAHAVAPATAPPSAGLSILETSTGLVLHGWKTWPSGTFGAYPIVANVAVDVLNTDNRVERATGSVVFYLDGAPYGPEVPVDAEGIAHMTMPTDTVGTYHVYARYTGSATQAPSTSRTQEYIVQPAIVVPHYPTKPAKSSVKASFTKASKHRVKAKVTISSVAKVSGRIEIRYGSKVVATGTLKSGAKSITLTTKKLKKGTRKLKIRYLGSSKVSPTSKTYTVKVS